MPAICCVGMGWTPDGPFIAFRCMKLWLGVYTQIARTGDGVGERVAQRGAPSAR